MLGGKRKESVDSEEHVLKGIDGFAARSDKPSKYAEKKNKKLARKEAKLKVCGLVLIIIFLVRASAP